MFLRLLSCGNCKGQQLVQIVCAKGTLTRQRCRLGAEWCLRRGSKQCLVMEEMVFQVAEKPMQSLERGYMGTRKRECDWGVERSGISVQEARTMLRKTL